MSEVPVAETLAARRDLVVLLRLVVEAGGRVIYGEVVDTRRPPSRFVGEQGLVAAIRSLCGSGVPAAPIGGPRTRGEPARVPNKRRRLPARSAEAPAVGRRRGPDREASPTEPTADREGDR